MLAQLIYARNMPSISWNKTFIMLVTTVTSLFLDNKFGAMLVFIHSEDHSIGGVTRYFWRRKYQSRDIHFYLLLWIKNS